jgi:hypothetical protein
MPTIYISDRGDDKNDGLSLERPVYSLERAMKLQGGRNDFSWHFGPRAWKRIQKELSEKQKAKRLERPRSIKVDGRSALGSQAHQRLLC